MKFATKTQRVVTDERHDENTNGRGGAPGHITCFNRGSLGPKAARCPETLSRDGYPRRQDYQSRGRNPSYRHTAASVVTTDGSLERKRASMEQIAEFRRDGQIPVGGGTFLPITGVAVTEEKVINMPVTDGYVGNLVCEGVERHKVQQRHRKRGSYPRRE